MKVYSSTINDWINNIHYPSRPIGLYEPIKYMLGGGGKRVRPTLLCASAEAFGLDCERVKNQALAIEMFHNFTLLHDDVMDNADIRHGVPTVHRKWNVPTAILSGDTMLTMAVQLAADTDADCKGAVLDMFNKTSIEIYEGQQYDMNFESETKVSLEEYMEMIRLKTAVLLGAASAIGGMMANAGEENVGSLYKYGEQMGLAFQLRDDYLDTFGDASKFGKALGGDILNDKKTWLQIRANELSHYTLLNEARQLSGNDKIAFVTGRYRELNVDKECLDLISTYTNNAIGYLDRITGMKPEFREFLTNVASGAIDRQS